MSVNTDNHDDQTVGDLSEWFIVLDGPEEDGTNARSMAIAFPASQEAEARSTFREDIENNYVTKNRGLILGKLTGVTEDQYEELSELDSLAAVVEGGFKGYNFEVLEKWGVSLEDWDASAHGGDEDEDPEGAVVTDEGFVFEADNANPYADKS